MIVRPSTTCEFSDRPLKAATVRVVRLFAAAIDHSVSPGWTTCGTAAPAVEGTRAETAKKTADSGRLRKVTLHASGLTPTRLALRARIWKRRARAYVTLQGAMQAADAKLWLPKWRW